MSSKKERSKPKPQVHKPSGKVPQAMVTTRHGLETMERAARGFSIGELSAAGMLLRQARNWGVSVDERRRTVLEGNVEMIKGWASHIKRQAAEAPRVHEEVAKVEKAVKEEAAEVVKEVVKVEKKAKKAAAKVEKKVVEKAKKPRAKKAPKKE